jgi:small subunit ribosomal protein S20
MPVTKTAKRALRSSKRKTSVNKLILSRLEVAIRIAKREGGKDKVLTAISFVDRAAKKKFIHKNKAARIKSSLSKLLPRRAKTPSGSKAKQKVSKSETKKKSPKKTKSSKKK